MAKKKKDGELPKARHCPQCQTVFDLNHPQAPYCEPCKREYGHPSPTAQVQGKKARNLMGRPERSGPNPFDPKNYPQFSKHHPDNPKNK